MTDLSRSRLFSCFNGIILADKKSGMTSYDLIRRLKKVFF